ncbi:type II CRISPR-associated endonuclease Cas1 [Entomomonas asaccharolytica]|uniref:Type II CRISPR-associated endonuclease Cas1 n=1 Tax=Entomomonas asaccharolytica TaxID=2785331 RepID=A0A974NGV8_9GAMM|nr:type II CRISPR-associated endonuclease Cas1 [Entomomonas asaccharolytica]QQP86486.1 type II CRISPR-associated endonuclease Cas1 [Entomomonas asaccharolytica]
MISQPARLRCEHFSLAIEQEQTVHIPFEDIAIIILDHREILLTHPLLAKCAEQGISLFSTGDDHLPNGVFIPYLQHSRVTRLLRLQQNLKRPLIKQAWAAIVQQKILNQAKCLAIVKPEQEIIINLLRNMANKIRSGDPKNLEAQAAARYFGVLFQADFKRKNNNVINAALNYGYAILRGAIARGIVAHGLFPAFGLFHNNEQNAFNLADDLIEPFRPQVDLWVAKNIIDQTELSTFDKAALVKLLHVDIKMPTGIMTTLSAIEYCIESLVRYLETSGEQLLALPSLVGDQLHQNE